MQRVAARLLKHWYAATADQRKDGREWYVKANREARRLARLHGVSLATAAGVIAALSPRLQWTSNVRAAHKLLDGQDVTGVFLASLTKAQHIYTGERPLRILSGPKVRAFYGALMGRPEAVVDVWIARAAGVDAALTPKSYATVAGALQMAADSVRVPVHVFQATTWVQIRGKA